MSTVSERNGEALRLDVAVLPVTAREATAKLVGGDVDYIPMSRVRNRIDASASLRSSLGWAISTPSVPPL